MARAARDTRRKIARVGQVALLLTACATIQEPPGGPPDFDPPFIMAIIPDSGATVTEFDDDVQVQFNEVVDERSGSGLQNLVLVSPYHEELNVSWKRSRVTIKPKGGWHEDVVYQITLLPGFADLRNNRLDSTKTVVFSTGGDIPDTRIAGTVLDWDQGSAAPRALIEAIRLPDSLTFVGTADSIGDFELRYLHPGSYLVAATIDQNNNWQRDYREVFDSITVSLDTSVTHVFWAVAHDTVGPRISEITELDSITIQVDFLQNLVPGEPEDTTVKVYALPDTTLLETVSVWNQVTYDSVREEEAIRDSIRQAAVADSIAAAVEDSVAAVTDSIAAAVEDSVAAVADSIAAAEADSIAAVRDSMGIDTTVAEAGAAGGAGVEEAAADSIVEGLLQVVDTADQVLPDSAAAADTSRVLELLAERPQLSSSWYVRLVANMTPGARYLIMAVAENLTGAIAESQGILILPEPVDTTQVPADTT